MLQQRCILHMFRLFSRMVISRAGVSIFVSFVQRYVVGARERVIVRDRRIHCFFFGVWVMVICGLFD